MTPAALAFPGLSWWWLALAAAVVLVPLARLALRPDGGRQSTDTPPGIAAALLGLRVLGIGLVLLALLDPQWTSRRAVRGANLVAVIADNSRGLAIRDTGEARSRGELLRDALVAAETGWYARLADTFQVRTYRFDRGLQRVRDFSSLDFAGDRTALAATLAQVRERFAGQPLAAVLLFTDGNATDITDPATLDLAGLPPIHPVVVGRGAVPDLRVDHAGVRQTAFDDAPVTVTAGIAATDLGAREVQVRVRPLDAAASGDSGPPERTVRLPRDGSPVPVEFSWRPVGAGIQFHEVSVYPVDGDTLAEATTANNTRVVMIDRGRAARRILYVAGRPGWDFKLLNRALQEDPQLQMVALLRTARREPKFEFKGRAGEANNPMFRGFGADESEAPRYDQPVVVRLNTRDEAELRGGFPTTAEELFAYDAVILDDVEAAFFTREQLSLLRRFVADRGGGLLMLGGADSLESGGYADSPLASVLPVYLDRTAAPRPAGELRWMLTREGWVQPWVRVRPEESLERARLAAKPSLRVTHAIASTKPGATVLAEVEDEAFARFPALVAQPFGAGRSAALTIGDLWRWGLKGEGEQADLARFWRQIARWLVSDVPPPVSLTLERTGDPATDGVRLVVEARDRAFRPADAATVRLTVRRIEMATTADAGGFQSAALAVEPVAGAAGRFGATFAGRDAGAYLAEAEATTPDGEVLGRAQAGWIIETTADEFRAVAPDRALLADIARRTGGELLTLDDVPGLIARLPAMPAPINETTQRALWHTPWVFLVVLGCFVAEWIWRRKRGLP